MDLLPLWNRFRRLPLGKKLFSQVLGLYVPYTGTVDPEIVELRPHFARVEMEDRRSKRNHLQSVHAMALANLAEVASGLAFIATLPPTHRAILVRFEIAYLKKGRGRLTAEATVPPLPQGEEFELTLDSIVKDRDGHTVAQAKATWKAGRRKK